MKKPTVYTSLLCLKEIQRVQSHSIQNMSLVHLAITYNICTITYNNIKKTIRSIKL